MKNGGPECDTVLVRDGEKRGTPGKTFRTDGADA